LLDVNVLHKWGFKMNSIANVLNAMIMYYSGDPKRISHFLKVYGFAKAIGENENIGKETQHILEITALTHDIGIKNSEAKWKSSAGSYQQTEGPPEAKKLLESLGVQTEIIERVCWLIAHHHTYTDIIGIDYQILIEADFLVNAYEDDMSANAVRSFRNKIFKTTSGIMYLDNIFKMH
jgi:HD superfamily phosphodiesterase